MGRRQAIAYDYNAWDEEEQRAAFWRDVAMQEAAQALDAERRQLEAQLQMRLIQVGAEFELIDTVHRDKVSQLRWRVFYMFVLAAAIAGAAGWMFTKKIRPRVNMLQAMIGTLQIESNRLSSQLRAETEKARSMEEKYLAARAELDRTKKPEPPKSQTPVQPAAPISKPSRVMPPPPAAPTPPPVKKACKCVDGDPMCGCL